MANITRPGTTGGGAANAFSTIQPITGTSPTADSSTDTLTFVSGDGSITIAGDSTTDTLDIRTASAGVSDHGGLTGLADDDHTQYALLAGRATAQTLIGGTGSGADLTLTSTAHATKGKVVVTGRFATGSTNTVGTTNADTFVLGTGNNVSGISSGALGTGNITSGNYGALCIGNGNQATAQGSVAIGISNVASGIQSTAIGTRSYATTTGAVVISDANPTGVAAADTTGVTEGFLTRFNGGYKFIKTILLGPRMEWQQATVNTTDATVTTLLTYAVPTTTSHKVTAHIVARRTGGAAGAAGDDAAYELKALVRNIAGTVTVSAITKALEVEAQAGWDATIDVSTTNIRVRITGAVDNNITWNCRLEVDSV